MDNSQEEKKKKLSWKEAVKTQQLWGMILFPSFCCLLIMYLVIGVLLILFGSIMLANALNINDIEIRYDDKWGSNPTCTVTFTPSETLKEPKFYYKIDNFYANHRNFVKSISYQQLRADTSSSSSCSPVTKNKDISTPLTAVDGTTTLDPDKDVNPCGLRAKYYFTDTFALSTTSGSSITIDQTKISHSVDRNSRFKNSKNYMTEQWKDKESEHLMVWYQTDAFPNFIKLWGSIKQDLVAGTSYQITISNTYINSDIDSKSIYISETNFFGGNNLTFGLLYLIGGIVFILLAVVMVILEVFISPRKEKTKVSSSNRNH